MDSNCTNCLLRDDQQAETDEIQLLTQYIPYKIIRFIGETDCCIFDHKIEKLEGIVVYFDIIGFTPIVVNYLSTNRDIGDLSNTLSEFYSVIIEKIREFGGSIFQFAGDSLLICFDHQANESEQDNFRRAFASMLRALELSNNYNSVSEKTNGFALCPKIGIGCGSFYQILLGSRELFITPVIAGTAVSAAIQCEQACTKQEIIVSPEVQEYAATCGLKDNFTEKDGLYHLDGIPDSFIDTAPHAEFFAIEDLFKKPRFYNRLTAFLNPVIIQQIKNSFQGFAGEYKDITCIMARFDGNFAQKLGRETPGESFDPLNSIYMLMQNKACRYGGYCMKPDISDKGVVFPVIFGTPAALENKERNAVLCAAEILTAGKKDNAISAVNVGIATGMVYSGEFGGFLRKDYTVIGNSINFAARLMSYAAGKDAFSIIIDEQTKKNTNTMCTTDTVSGITCKGYSGPQTAYRFITMKKMQQTKQGKCELIGRDKELQQLCTLFMQSLTGRICFAPVIGDAGMGKSYLVEQFISAAEQQEPDVLVLYGHCYQYEEATVFFCWRPIIRQILGLPDELSDSKTECLVHNIFDEHFPEETSWIPVFLNMIGYDFPENQETVDTDISLKQLHFFSLIHRLMLFRAETNPLIIILEDIHWSDSVSLNMLEYLINSCSQAKILVTVVSRSSDYIFNFFSSRNIPVIDLKQISDDAAAELTKRLLNMEENEPLLTRKIIATSDGNPFFIENIVRSLLESGTLVEDTSGKRHLSQNIKNIQNIIIPSSIQNIILSRLNSLKFEEQIVCKTASAIGRSFYSDCLKELLPDGISELTLENALNDFETHNLIVKDDKQDPEYSFKQMIIHDVIYDTILDTTKKELNLMLLSYLENKYADNLLGIIERLEYHAQQAKAYDKVFTYALEAARKAEKQFDAQDAITHYLIAFNAWNNLEGKKDIQQIYEIQLRLGDTYRIAGNSEKAIEDFTILIKSCKQKRIKADALRGLGRCYQEQGKFEDAVATLEKALATLGKKAPKFLFTVYFDILKEILIQLFTYGVRKGRIQQYKEMQLTAAETRTDILCILNKLYYFGLPEKIAWSSLANFNNTLHFSDTTEKYCLSAGDYAVSLVSAGFTKFGERIFDQGNKLAQRTNSLTAASIFKSRYAYYFLFYNDPGKSAAILEETSHYFRKIGEQWELMTAEGALGQNYFLMGDFEKSIQAYLETETIARSLHSAMHIGWAYNKVPFMRYLRKEISAEQAETQLQEGIRLSDSVHDHMTLCIHYGHLAYIAAEEHNYKNALLYAEKIMNENKIYRINIPHVKISYVNAIEAVCAAFRDNAVPKNRKSQYMALADSALSRVLKLSRDFHMLAGPAARAAATLALVKQNKRKAEEWCSRSASILQNSPYIWEYRNTIEFADRNNLLQKGE
jgi:adenylate cyclase